MGIFLLMRKPRRYLRLSIQLLGSGGDHRESGVQESLQLTLMS
jgi:hypothetical protein